MKPIYSLRRMAPALCAAIAILATSAPAGAQDGNFCPLLKRVIGEKAKGFNWLKVKPYHGSTKEWDARLNLPGTQFCRVDLERKNYNCWITGLNDTWTKDGAAKLKTRITACLGEPASPEKTDELTEASRTTVAWQSEGADIQLITRIGKVKPIKHSVFIYVQ
jgi:hypothetical protein